jgi:membrane-bound serine protease (ClpP class)
MIPYILLVVGLILAWLEFYLPGGLLAILAAVFILLAQASFYTEYNSLGASLGFFMITLALVGAVVYFAINRIRKSADKNTFFLSKDQEGYKAASYSEKMIGKEGVALTDFGPSGFVFIEGERYAAITRGSYLNKGTHVVVIAGESGYLVIKSLK